MKTANPVVKMLIICIWSGITVGTIYGAVEGNLCNGRCCPNFTRIRDQCIECPEGKFGENCNENCQAHYHGKLCKEKCNCSQGFFCSSVYGCVPQEEAEGCPTGKHGEKCEENCPPNKFGPNCKTSCKCLAFNYCHPEKGCRDISFPRTTDGLADINVSMSTKGNNNQGETHRGTLLFLSLAIIIVVGIFTGLLYVHKGLKTRTISPVATSNNTTTRNFYFEEIEHSNEDLEYPSLVTPGPSSASLYSTSLITHDRDTRLSELPYNTTNRSNNETTGHSERENYYYTVSLNLAENWRWYAKTSRHGQDRNVYRDSGMYTSLSFDNLLNFSDDEHCNSALKTMNETM